SLRATVARTFEHKDIRSAAKAITELHSGRSPWLSVHVHPPVSTGLASVCDAFVELQDRRHEADYDLAATFTRGIVNGRLSLAAAAHVQWVRERRSHNARVFMLAAAGLLAKR